MIFCKLCHFCDYNVMMDGFIRRVFCPSTTQGDSVMRLKGNPLSTVLKCTWSQ